MLNLPSTDGGTRPPGCPPGRKSPEGCPSTAEPGPERTNLVRVQPSDPPPSPAVPPPGPVPLPEKPRNRRLRLFLAMGAGILALLCLGGVGVFISTSEEATKIQRAEPCTVVEQFLRAYLVN